MTVAEDPVAAGAVDPGDTIDARPTRGVQQASTAGLERRGVFAAIGRLGWGVADQAVSSLSNFALGLYVARTFGATSFGAFSLAFVTYTVILNAARGTATDPLLVRFSFVVRKSWRRAASAASAVSLAVGVVAGVVCLGLGLVLPEPLGPAFFALGLGLPGLVVQDCWRFAFFADGRGPSALINDVVWTALLIAALVAMHVTGTGTVFNCLIAFGASASIAAIFGSFQAGVVPRPRLLSQWIREHHGLSLRYLVENVAASGAHQIRASVLGAVAGLASVGYVRGAEMLMGPFAVIQMGIAQVAVPEASKAFKRSPTRLTRFCFVLGSAMGVGAAAWGLVLVFAFPLGPGPLLLKDVWGPSSQLLVAVTLHVVMGSFCVAATSGLRAMGVACRSLRAQLMTSAAFLIGGSAGAFMAGAVGTTWGVAAANAFGAVVWWHHLRAALRDHHRDPSTAVEMTSCRRPGLFRRRGSERR